VGEEEGDESLSEDDLRQLTEEIEKEEALDEASRRLGRRRSARVALRIVGGIFLVAATTWAVTGAMLPFWSDSPFNTSSDEVARFVVRLREIYAAAQNVTYATVFALGGILIITYLLSKLGAASEPIAGPSR
jgi:di/tricarboxylate transporter